MSQQPFSSAALRGAVDLGALAAANQRRGAATGPGGAAVGAGASAGSVVVDVTEADFQSLVLEQSLTVPVVIDLWADWCGPCKQLSPVLERLAVEYAGRFLLAKVDVDANPQLAQAFQAQSIPMVVAVVKGQPVPLFTGALPETEVRAYLDELLKLAEANGVDGRIDVAVGDGEADPDGEAAEVEEVLPPLHQAAYDAIERDDLDGAIAAYEQALRESPADDLAKIGLAQVALMKRTEALDAEATLAAGDAAPQDVAAQLAAADVEFTAGRVEAAFSRLVQAVRVTAGSEREEVRSRIVELFSLLGPDDPRVRQARIALTSALF
jgi:putative thioredoxin